MSRISESIKSSVTNQSVSFETLADKNKKRSDELLFELYKR